MCPERPKLGPNVVPQIGNSETERQKTRQSSSHKMSGLEFESYETSQPVISLCAMEVFKLNVVAIQTRPWITNFNTKYTKIKHFVFPNRSASRLYHYLPLHVCHDAKSPKFPVEKSRFERHPWLARKAYGAASQVAACQGGWT